MLRSLLDSNLWRENYKWCWSWLRQFSVHARFECKVGFTSVLCLWVRHVTVLLFYVLVELLKPNVMVEYNFMNCSWLECNFDIKFKCALCYLVYGIEIYWINLVRYQSMSLIFSILSIIKEEFVFVYRVLSTKTGRPKALIFGT